MIKQKKKKLWAVVCEKIMVRVHLRVSSKSAQQIGHSCWKRNIMRDGCENYAI
jgi:hypothetical protein